jgi:hypothetical protein
MELKEITFDEYETLEQQRRIKQVSNPLSVRCLNCSLREGIQRLLNDAERARGEDLFAPNFMEANAFMKGKKSVEHFERHEQFDSSKDHPVYPVVLYKIE